MGYLLKDTRADELAKAIKAASRGEVQLHPEAAKRLIREVRMPESPEKLTKRETEVLRLIAKGLSSKDIAHQLVVKCKNCEDPREQCAGQASPPQPHPGRAVCAARRAGLF